MSASELSSTVGFAPAFGDAVAEEAVDVGVDVAVDDAADTAPAAAVDAAAVNVVVDAEGTEGAKVGKLSAKAWRNSASRL